LFRAVAEELLRPLGSREAELQRSFEGVARSEHLWLRRRIKLVSGRRPSRNPALLDASGHLIGIVH